MYDSNTSVQGRLAVGRRVHHQHRDRADAGVGLHRRLRARLEPAPANIVVRRLRRHRLQRHRHGHDQFRAGAWLGLRAPFAGLVGNFSVVTALAGNSCNPDYSFYQVGSRASRTRSSISISAWTPCSPASTPPTKAPASMLQNASRPPSSCSTTRAYGLRWSVGSATSIREDPALVVAGSESRDE